MPKVIFLPNEEFCPEGMVVDAAAGDNLLEVAHNAGVEIHHACDGSCACTTCHVVIRAGEPRPYHYGYLLSFRKSKAGVPVCLYKGAVHGWT